jgi:hypothetical protein
MLDWDALGDEGADFVRNLMNRANG